MQQRAIKTRHAILDAARDEFSAKGYHGARVDVIAIRAGVNKQRLYANFTNKAGLFSAVLKDAFVTLAQEESRLMKLGTADLPRLTALVLECYAGLHERHPDFWRLLAWENLEGGLHATVLTGMKDPVLSHLRTLYKQGQREGVFLQDVPFEGYLFTLLAVSYFMVSNRQTLKQSMGLDCSRRSVRQRLHAAVIRQLETQRMPT